MHSRREIKFLEFYSKWLLWKPATAFWSSVLQYWRQHFLLFYKTRFDCQISISCKFLFCSVQWTYLLTVNSYFQCFLQLYLEITLFFTTPSGQIISCHDTIGLWSAQVSGILLKNLAKWKCWREVSRYKSKLLRKMHFKFLTRSIKHLTSHK